MDAHDSLLLAKWIVIVLFFTAMLLGMVACFFETRQHDLDLIDELNKEHWKDDLDV